MNLKQKLSKKLKKTGGFTLIEMLIVVAIIAILVAVSIPMVNASLTRAKVATDDANERAAKAAALAEYLLSNPDTSDDAETVEYCYNAQSGQATPMGTCGNPDDYGQGSASGEDSLTEGITSREGHIHVTIDHEGIATVTWE